MSEIDDIAKEIVDYYIEFKKVYNLNEAWRERFKFDTLKCSARYNYGFDAVLYYQCRIEIYGHLLFLSNGNEINESTRDIIMHWNNEAKHIAPHFKIVKEYESDFESRQFLPDGYHYYLEANTLKKLSFFHLSENKLVQKTNMVLSSVRKYLPKDAKIYNPREHGSDYDTEGYYIPIELEPKI